MPSNRIIHESKVFVSIYYTQCTVAAPIVADKAGDHCDCATMEPCISLTKLMLIALFVGGAVAHETRQDRFLQRKLLLAENEQSSGERIQHRTCRHRQWEVLMFVFNRPMRVGGAGHQPSSFSVSNMTMTSNHVMLAVAYDQGVQGPANLMTTLPWCFMSTLPRTLGWGPGSQPQLMSCDHLITLKPPMPPGSRIAQHKRTMGCGRKSGTQQPEAAVRTPPHKFAGVTVHHAWESLQRASKKRTEISACRCMSGPF